MLGIAAGIAGVLILAAFGWAYHWTTSNYIRLDASNCPVSGPVAVHALLIDRSDPITPLQAARFRQILDEMVAEARPGERLDLYVAEGDGVNTLAPVLSVCSSGRGASANELYQNPQAIERAFQDRFVGPLRQEAAKLMQPMTRENSPLLESIRTVAVTSFGEVRGKPHRMTIVSDMIQHSQLNSHFRGETSAADLQRRPQWPQVRANLRGVEVRILYLLRPAARRPGGQPIQSIGHQAFWREIFEAEGVVRLSLEAL
jgi:hypothetical protein